jgi:hypothetical protein
MKTREERMMITKHAQPPLRKPPRRDPGSAELDPAKVSATLRDLALRAHQLVRAIDGNATGPGAGDPEQELTEILAQIVRLQRTLASHQMDGLCTYVAALRERVEECLG